MVAGRASHLEADADVTEAPDLGQVLGREQPHLMTVTPRHHHRPSVIRPAAGWEDA